MEFASASELMVEKIDRPEAPPPYFIQGTLATKRDRQQQESRPPPDEFSGSHAAPEWQRIYSTTTNRRYMKVRREDIGRCYFRQTLMQRGVALLEADIELKDGRIIKNAQMILPSREQYWVLKKLQPGQEMPLELYFKEAMIEISIPGLAKAPQPAKPTAELKKIDRRKLIIYAAIGVIALLLIIFAATR